MFPFSFVTIVVYKHHIIQVYFSDIFKRPGVASADIQTSLSFIQ